MFECVSPEGIAAVKVDSSIPKHLRELAVLAVTGGGLPVPRVLHSDPSPPALLVLEHIGGSGLGGGGPMAWQETGEFVRRIHELVPPAEVEGIRSSGRSCNEHLRWWADHERDLLLQYHLLPGATVNHLHEILVRAFATVDEAEPRLLHGDCQPDHYFLDDVDQRVAGIIDFGDAVVGDAANDLAVLTLEHPNGLDSVINGYQPDSHLADRLARLNDDSRPHGRWRESALQPAISDARDGPIPVPVPCGIRSAATLASAAVDEEVRPFIGPLFSNVLVRG